MQDVQRIGYTDLIAMPEDGRRYEIHGGELVVVAAPLLRHQIAALEIATILNAYGHRSGGRAVTAPFDIVFDEYDVVQPDVVFFRAERSHLVRLDEVTRAAPDIAVEVLQGFVERGFRSIYLVPPILRGGRRDYAAAQRVIETVKG